jgi:hypothetical protein
MASKEWAAYLFKSVDNGKLTDDEATFMSRAVVEPSSSDSKNGEPFAPPRAKNREQLPPPSTRIKPAAHLRSDAHALGAHFEEELPAQVLIRAAQVYTILYGFADAQDLDLGALSCSIVESVIELGPGVLTRMKHQITKNLRISLVP